MSRVLVGRDAELRALDAAIGAHGSRYVALAGEPGIGKTALLRVLVERASASGMAVLAGRAAELEHDLPFAAWADALESRLRTEGLELAAALGAETVQELSAVLPALRWPSQADVRAALADDRRRLAIAVRVLLERLAAAEPVALVLDDLHWADPASIDVLAALLRRPPQADILIAVALRPRQAPPRLIAALARAQRDAGLVQLVPSPLEPEDAERLLPDGLAAGLRARVRAGAQGNPFYLEQLARSAELGGRVPRSLGEAILAELATLAPGARAVLEAAAVTGDPFRPELVAAAAGVPERLVLAQLDVLREHDLVRPTALPRQFAMRHPLVREVVYTATEAAWRGEAHRRAAKALTARGEPPAASAHHVARAAAPGEREAVEHLRTAAAAVAGRTPHAAAGWLAAALGLVGDHDEQRLELLEALSESLAAAGRLTEARNALDEALGLCPGGRRRAMLITRLASIEHGLGRHAEARQRLLTELEAATIAPPATRAGLLFELAVNAFHARELEAMEAWARRALEAAEAAGDRPLDAAARAAAALAAVLSGPSSEATELTAGAAEALDRLTDEQLAERLDAPHLLTLAEMYVERFEPMVEHARRAIAVARASGQGRLVAALTLAQGFGETMLGRLHDARTHLEAGVESARLNDNPHALSWVLMNLTLALTAAGDLDAALAAGHESAELAADAEDTIVSAYPGAALAGALLERGEPNAAAAVLRDAAGGPDLPLIPGFWRVACLELLVRAELAADRLDEAVSAAMTAERSAADLGQRLPNGWAARARASVLLAQGEATAAASLAAQAVEDLRGGRALVEAAMAEVVLGRALAGAGDRDGAFSALDRAAAELGRFGARRGHEAAIRELRRLGHREVARTADPLTDRERHIAGLAAGGATNRQIADQLFLSEKTIEGHLRRAFAKLRVRSRSELADAFDDG